MDHSEESPRPTTPSSPVVIPTRTQRDLIKDEGPQSRTGSKENIRTTSNTTGQRRTRPVHSQNEMAPSVAALLASTAIPPQRLNHSLRKQSAVAPRLTVDAMFNATTITEKEFSISLGKSPMDILLSPPDELDQDNLLPSSGRCGSLTSSRTMSCDSMPSLDNESITEYLSSPSLHSLMTPSYRGRRTQPRRRFTLSPPGESTSQDEHPLLKSDIDFEDLDFRVFQKESFVTPQNKTVQEIPRRKSAFKSNLTASLKALRSAAKSFSNLTAPMITPDDFLTRSIISIDPRVPFTDERMPPRLEDTPTPALRRYLNPTTNAPIEAHVPSSLAQTMGSTACTASIQMQTYKISRLTKTTSPSVISRRTQTTPEEVFADVAAGPVARQRDMRENSDFIRIAVMEMAMRKNGKLDSQKPGRARWALPPRKLATKPYQVGTNGVPLRWVGVTHI
ncbi:hypothetical protein BJ878DRAFT_424401 [Calycina marina]|uniref:Uncharacterized protein n=1 Tax=Calycina marina TaxID=1763456 RepID=A0A9P7Z1C5_9HELO|nr:hypothetical protein BJ878DRAFT_424401 [Calycina marina]